MNLPIKKYVFVGSYAMGIFPYKDIDVVCYKDDIDIPVNGDEYICSFILSGKKIECLLADNMTFLQSLYNRYESGDKASYDDLLTLKAGHLHVPNRNWEKHMRDYLVLRKFAERNEKNINQHIKDTNQHANTYQVKLKGVSKKDFFDDAVIKYYDHDYLHEQMALGRIPSYKLMQKDDTVECHQDLWSNMTHQEQLNCVIEESSVIALERFIIPKLEKKLRPMPIHIAYKKAIEKVCTTLSSGWFRTFCHENYREAVSSFPEQKIKSFLNKNYTEYEII